MNTAHFKERLEGEKATLEAELATVGRRNPSNPNDWEARPSEVGQEADPNDQADLMESYSENNAILTDLEARYSGVIAALARIEGGSYGTCITGGEAIEEARLEADPSAMTCKAHMNG